MPDWTGVVLIEGEETSDGRLIVSGGTEWRELPLPVMKLRGSYAYEVVGSIETINRVGNELQATGTWTGEPLPKDTVLVMTPDVDMVPKNMVTTIDEIKIMHCVLRRAVVGDQLSAWPGRTFLVIGEEP